MLGHVWINLSQWRIPSAGGMFCGAQRYFDSSLRIDDIFSPLQKVLFFSFQEMMYNERIELMIQNSLCCEAFLRSINCYKENKANLIS